MTLTPELTSRDGLFDALAKASGEALNLYKELNEKNQNIARQENKCSEFGFNLLQINEKVQNQKQIVLKTEKELIHVKEELKIAKAEADEASQKSADSDQIVQKIQSEAEKRRAKREKLLAQREAVIAKLKAIQAQKVIT